MTVRILQGDCRELLRTLPDASVHCVVTSPPYYGLRDYNVAGQIGLEPSPDEYIAQMVAVFREVRRVLREDGTLWLNLGDSYARDAAKGQHKPGDTGKQNYIIERGNGRAAGGMDLRGSSEGFLGRADRPPVSRDSHAVKEKDLLMIPARVALALQADGWWLRSDIIWHKPSCLPESVRDRPTNCHEHVFLLTKAARYFYDAEAIMEPTSPSTHARLAQNVEAQIGSARANGGAKTNGPTKAVGGSMRNARSVWSINSGSFSEAHFATFPPELAERCIKAGTSERGACPCGAPWVRVVTKGAPDVAHKAACGADAAGGYNGRSTKDHAAAGVQDASAVKARILAGMRERISEWRQGCACEPSPTVPCVVLDPFAGAFTTCLVADRVQRDSIGIELSGSYCDMAKRRLISDSPLLAQVSA